ncbi:hypothetical protein F5884DRAFT_799090 [Xylogone sp. PMI_703]|nr:hypothetical protein F5884DRAFT_799090 [Xylogone sp. PMI_703]
MANLSRDPVFAAAELVTNIEAREDTEDSEDSSSSEKSKDLNSRTKHAPRMLKQMSAYMQLMEERIQSLERQIRSLEGYEEDQKIPSQKKPHRKPNALVTAVHRVEGLHFDSLERTNVIDVLYEPLQDTKIDGDDPELRLWDLEGRMPGRVRINSPVILKMLEVIASPHFTSQRTVIPRPFKILCIHQDRIRKYLDGLDSPDRAHIRCLIEVLDTDLSFLKNIKNGKLEEIAFQDLWHLFQPGDIIFNNTSKSDKEAHMVMSTGIRDSVANNSSHFVIDCFHYDYDGQGFGPIQTSIEIPAYEGNREIQSLPVLPSQFLPDVHSRRDYLKERGLRFVKVTNSHSISHFYYSGATLGKFKVELDGQVIIDFQAAYQTLQHDLPTIGLSVNLDYHTMASKNSYYCNSESCIICKYLDRDNVYDLQRRNTMISEFKPPLTQTLQKNDLQELQCILLPYRVYGFTLWTRKWYSLHIDLLYPVKASSDGFEDLVLPGGHKSIIMSMINMHSRPSSGRRPGFASSDTDEASTETDLIKGKSQGLIMLLHGAPGVGKTSTAECAAAATGRPLMYLTAADLGLTSAEMEANLEITFSLAHKWGCILLLTEADIFLQRRTGLEMERNAMVSTFLKSLGYFSGILFMTTDRAGTLDEGCKSRIHISLYYPPLDEKSTLKIWNMNLRRVQEMNHQRVQMGEHGMKVRSHQIKAYARQAWKSGLRWNGRQIRNAFQTAVALAKHDAATGTVSKDSSESSDSDNGDEKLQRLTPPTRKVLTEAHFKQVVAASQAFDRYLGAVYGAENSFRSYEGIRDDEMRPGTRERKGYKARKASFVSSDSESSESSESSDTDSREKKYKKPLAKGAPGIFQAKSSVPQETKAETTTQLKTEAETINPANIQSILEQVARLLASNTQQLPLRDSPKSLINPRAADSSRAQTSVKPQEKRATKEDSSD